jgi:hypothetical protein
MVPASQSPRALAERVRILIARGWADPNDIERHQPTRLLLFGQVHRAVRLGREDREDPVDGSRPVHMPVRFRPFLDPEREGQETRRAEPGPPDTG